MNPSHIDANERGDVLVVGRIRGASVETQCEPFTGKIIKRGNDSVMFTIKNDGSTEVIAVSQQVDDEFSDYVMEKLGFHLGDYRFSRLFKYGSDSSVMFTPTLRSFDSSSFKTGTALSLSGQNGYDLQLTPGRAISNIPGYEIVSISQVIASQNGEHFYASAKIKRDSDPDSTAIPSLLYLNKSNVSRLIALSAPVASSAAAHVPEFQIRVKYNSSVSNVARNEIVRVIRYDYDAVVKMGELGDPLLARDQIKATVLDDGTLIFTGKPIKVMRVIQNYGEGNPTVSPSPYVGQGPLLRLRPDANLNFRLEYLLWGTSPLDTLSQYYVDGTPGFNVADDGSVVATVSLKHINAHSLPEELRGESAVIAIDSQGQRRIIYHPEVNELPDMTGAPLFNVRDLARPVIFSAGINSRGTVVTCASWTDPNSFDSKKACHIHRTVDGQDTSSYLVSTGDLLAWNTARKWKDIKIYGMTDQDKIILSGESSFVEGPQTHLTESHFISVNLNNQIEDATPPASNADLTRIYPEFVSVAGDIAQFYTGVPPVNLRPTMQESPSPGSSLHIGNTRYVTKNLDLGGVVSGDIFQIVSGYPTSSRVRAIVRVVFDEPAGPVQCPADFDGNGSLSPNDIFSFLAAFRGGNLRADINSDGTVSLQDFFTFLQIFNRGC